MEAIGDYHGNYHMSHQRKRLPEVLSNFQPYVTSHNEIIEDPFVLMNTQCPNGANTARERQIIQGRYSGSSM